MAPNAVAYIATSQKGMACTPRDPKSGRFFFIFLDFGQISPQPFLASRGQQGGGGRGGQPTQPRPAAARNTPVGFAGCDVWDWLACVGLDCGALVDFRACRS